MSHNLMDDYIHAMKRVGRDECSRVGIARAVARERRRASCAHTAVSAQTIHAPSRAVNHHLRIAVVAACTVLLALGGAVALPLLMKSSSPATPVPGMQAFVLAAYADGSAVEDNGSTVMTSTDAIMCSGSWSEGDDGSYTTAYTIDPEIIGNDVVSVEYRSTNENVVLEGMRDRGKVRPGERLGTEYLPSITVGGPDATLPDLYQLDLRVTAPTSDAIKEAKELLYTGVYDEEASDRLSFEIERACAEELASGALEITATFADGSTQTRVYRIVPVDDFEQLWWKDKAAWLASLDDDAVDYEPLQLFALQQLN